MKRVLITVTAVASLAIASCTDNQLARSYGGTATIELPRGQKLLNVTWKGEADIWYLTRPMTATDSAETYTFTQERGDLLNIAGSGQVILKETK